MVVAGNHELSLDPRTWEEAAEYMDQAGETRQSTEQVKNKFYNIWNRFNTKYILYCRIYNPLPDRHWDSFNQLGISLASTN